MKELQLLPPAIWDLFVFVPMLAEAGHDWPAVFKLVPVSQLDKGAGSEDPLATRGVGCCAFLYTIWASIRYADSIQWQLSIVLSKIFKLGRSYSGQVSCANSAIQGCSLSVLITNIMYAIGHVVVHAATPAASLSSYVDDCKV
jgi:hypothetical protein